MIYIISENQRIITAEYQFVEGQPSFCNNK